MVEMERFLSDDLREGSRLVICWMRNFCWVRSMWALARVSRKKRLAWLSSKIASTAGEMGGRAVDGSSWGP